MPKIVDRDAMKRQILQGAMQAFLTKGFHAATIADVAEACELGKGTLYLYFKNKDALVDAMVAAHFAELEDRLFFDTPPKTLADFLDRLERAMQVPAEQADFIRVYFEVFGPRFASPEFRSGVAGYFERLGMHYADQLKHLKSTGAVREDLDADQTGRLLVSMIDGHILHRGLFDLAPADHAKQSAEAVAVFLKGLRAA